VPKDARRKKILRSIRLGIKHVNHYIVIKYQFYRPRGKKPKSDFSQSGAPPGKINVPETGPKVFRDYQNYSKNVSI
jgi:hypothetical protein